MRRRWADLHRPIDRFVDGGALWLDIETAEHQLTVERVRWLVNTKAIKDFLRGPEVLADGGAQVVPAVRKVRAEYPETHVVPAAIAGVPADRVPIVRPAATPSVPRLVLIKRLLNQLRNATGDGAAIRAGSEHWWHVSPFRTAMITDPSRTGVRVRKRDRDLLCRLGKDGAKGSVAAVP